MNEKVYSEWFKTLRKSDDNSNETRLHMSQPLNVIAGDGFDDSSPVTSIDNDKDYLKFSDEEGVWQTYKIICEECQIKDIVGTCNHCGIYQYGPKGINEQFDIKVRRINHGISTESSDVKSDS